MRSAIGDAEVFPIDGDNELLTNFLTISSDFSAIPREAVLSWNSLNSVNGQSYGNGGVKNWPREVVLSMATHENATARISAVDFCFFLPYFRMGETLSVAEINATPYQAFRAGFREGVKMCLERGMRPALSGLETKAEAFRDHVFIENRNRLKIWCSVGADVTNGVWAMYGARLGCKKLCLEDWAYEPIRDYDWFAGFWREKIWPEFRAGDGWSGELLAEALGCLEKELNQSLDLGITTLSPAASAFFKTVYVGPLPQKGLIFPEVLA